MYDYLSTHEDGDFYDYCMVSYLLKNTCPKTAAWPAVCASKTRTVPCTA